MYNKLIKNIDQFSFKDNDNIERLFYDNKTTTRKEFENYLNFISNNIYKNLKIEYLNKATKINEISPLDSKKNKDAISKSKYSAILKLINKNKNIKLIYWNQHYYFSNLTDKPLCFFDSIFTLDNKNLIICKSFDSYNKEYFKKYFNFCLNDLKNISDINYLNHLLENNKNKNFKKINDDSININFLINSLNHSFKNEINNLDIKDELKSSSISLIEMDVNNHD